MGVLTLHIAHYKWLNGRTYYSKLLPSTFVCTTCVWVTAYPVRERCLIMSPSPARYLREKHSSIPRLDCMNTQGAWQKNEVYRVRYKTRIVALIFSIRYIVYIHTCTCTCTLMQAEGWKRQGLWSRMRVSFARSRNSTSRRKRFNTCLHSDSW